MGRAALWGSQEVGNGQEVGRDLSLGVRSLGMMSLWMSSLRMMSLWKTSSPAPASWALRKGPGRSPERRWGTQTYAKADALSVV